MQKVCPERKIKEPLKPQRPVDPPKERWEGWRNGKTLNQDMGGGSD
jgi:hypothetical protein